MRDDPEKTINSEILNKDESIHALSILIKEIAKKHNTRVENIINAIKDEGKTAINIETENSQENKLQKTHPKQQTQDKNHQLIKSYLKEHTIPIDLFSENPKEKGYLELIIAYSKDVLKLRFSEIAKITCRDQRTIWASYSNLKKKNPGFKLEKSKVKKRSEEVHLSVFSDRKYSTFENLLLELSKKYTTNEIAALIGRDYKTVWTVLSRARRKAR